MIGSVELMGEGRRKILEVGRSTTHQDAVCGDGDLKAENKPPNRSFQCLYCLRRLMSSRDDASGCAK